MSPERCRNKILGIGNRLSVTVILLFLVYSFYMSIFNQIGYTLAGLKAKSPLRNTNLLPGEISQKLTGTTSQDWNRIVKPAFGKTDDYVYTQPLKSSFPSGYFSGTVNDVYSNSTGQTYNPTDAVSSGSTDGRFSPSGDLQNRIDQYRNAGMFEEARDLQGELDRQVEDEKRTIESKWDNYIRGLDDQLAGLSGTRSSREAIAESQYNQGVNTLGLQKTQGMQNLEASRAGAEQNQVKNLRDISSNIRNAFLAGNIYLGTRGAGDSSAANQYSYALNRMGTKQRSDVMSDTANILADINARTENLNNVYNTEVNNLSEQKNRQMQDIASWFYDAQAQIRAAQEQGVFNKAQDLQSVSRTLLDNAINRMNQLNTYILNKKAKLDDWVTSNDNVLKNARAKLETEATPNYTLPVGREIKVTPTVTPGGSFGYYPGGAFSSEPTKKRTSLFS
jgi:hypothetical protein